MKKISKAEVAYGGLNDALFRVLGEWKPQPLKTELEYRDALCKCLREVLPPDSRAEKEYRHSGTTSDLYLRYKGILGDGEVFFELKCNLKKKAQLARLIGQIEEVDPQRNTIFIVLIGESEPSLVARLRERYEEFLEGKSYLGSSRTMALVEVP